MKKAKKKIINERVKRRDKRDNRTTSPFVYANACECFCIQIDNKKKGGRKKKE